MENQTLSIEERLSRLEALLERLVAATPAANNTSTVAAAAIPEPEANLSAIFDDRNGNPTPRLSILLQESINAASNQVANNRTIDRVINVIDPTRIPSVI